jgi:4-hydroxy-2-oxoheptanedioate aldolase
MNTNRVKQKYRNNETAFGTYITYPTAAAVEVAAISGLDFVRLDAYHIGFNPETLENMIRTAYGHQITPWVRVRNDAWEIMSVLDFGAQAITVPNVGTVAEAEAIVRAVYYPPRGEREMARPLRFRAHSAKDYFDWANSELIISCQIEGGAGIENYKEIVKVEGLDLIQTGRGDLSLAMGVPGEDLHPKVLEMEERIVTAALDAGKQVTLLHSISEQGLERTRYWIEQGVRVLTLDSDYRILLREYANALKALA